MLNMNKPTKKGTVMSESDKIIGKVLVVIGIIAFWVFILTLG